MGNIIQKRDHSLEGRHSVPLGLYPRCLWDAKVLKRLIVEKKLAPIFKGAEEPSRTLEECPICFLFYPHGLNRSKCCKQDICTECFLQVQKHHTETNAVCPFCNREGFGVVYTGPKPAEQRKREEDEQQRVFEAEERAKRQSSNVQIADATVDGKREEGSLSLSPLPTISPSSCSPAEFRQSAIDARNATPSDDSSSFAHMATEASYHGLDPSNPHDLEEMMLMEAIRQSLATASPSSDPPAGQAGASSSSFNANDSFNNDASTSSIVDTDDVYVMLDSEGMHDGTAHDNDEQDDNDDDDGAFDFNDEFADDANADHWLDSDDDDDDDDDHHNQQQVPQYSEEL